MDDRTSKTFENNSNVFKETTKSMQRINQGGDGKGWNADFDKNLDSGGKSVKRDAVALQIYPECQPIEQDS